MKNGKAVYKSVYGKTYLETKEKLQKERELQKYAGNQDQKICKDKITFSEAMNQWMNYKQYSLSASSILKYRMLIENHIRPELGEIPVTEMNTMLISELIQKKSGKSGNTKELSSSTLQSILYIINAVYRYYIAQNQLSGKSFSVKLRYKPVPEVTVLNRTEQQLLEKSLLIEMDSSKLGIFICLYTGLRLGEICALKWEDISLENGCVRVTKTIQRLRTQHGKQKSELFLTTPKSVCSMRTIPMPSVLSSLIQQFQEEHACVKEHYLLSNEHKKPIEPRTYEYRFQGYLKQAGISHYKFHALRHTFATNCVNMGVDIKSLSEMMGHSNVSITLQKYVHSSFEMKQEQIEKICAIRR
jgi:integrase